MDEKTNALRARMAEDLWPYLRPHVETTIAEAVEPILAEVRRIAAETTAKGAELQTLADRTVAELRTLFGVPEPPADPRKGLYAVRQDPPKGLRAVPPPPEEPEP